MGINYFSDISNQTVRDKYITAFPHIYQSALESVSIKQFKAQLVQRYPEGVVRRLIEYDGLTVQDFSSGEDIRIGSFSTLWHFLREEGRVIKQMDLLIDLYFVLSYAEKKMNDRPSLEQVVDWSNRWASGLTPAVRQVREENKHRIILLLIEKIESRQMHTTRYPFKESSTEEEKYQQVERWWDDYRFQLHMAIKSPDELNLFLNDSLSEETMGILYDAKKKKIPFFVTPYYLSLLDVTSQAYDDETLRAYIIYTRELVDQFGEIKAWEKEDEVEDGKPNAAGWLLPFGSNIHRRYPEVAILIPDSVGRACGGLCASCQRMYDFQSERLNFNLKALRPKLSWPQKLERLMTYFEEDTQLRDILITGGDALMSQNDTLRGLLDAVYQMAKRKRETNAFRDDGEKYAEIQRIRLGSRLPVYLPMRVDDELIEILRDFKEKGAAIGIQQCYIQTHFQTPLELTPEAQKAIAAFSSAGWVVTNQLVFNVPASRRGHTTALRTVLTENGVVPYYTFSVKGFHENSAVFAPIARSMQEQKEEKAYGRLDLKEQEVLLDIVQNDDPDAHKISRYLKTRNVPFLATDRSVLNLPAIGKSMTFEMVGYSEEGKRILYFDHDHTRVHSPIIEQIGKVFITECKSIRSYLKELDHAGERPEDYDSIWSYTEGETEPYFKLYEYPDFPFTISEEMNNLKIKHVQVAENEFC